ncbi:MAG: hypothetical protein HQL75_14735 [Magnetococcales bacterium]|nr:hypothetical protein [Magnetococcales bacterium]
MNGHQYALVSKNFKCNCPGGNLLPSPIAEKLSLRYHGVHFSASCCDHATGHLTTIAALES